MAERHDDVRIHDGAADFCRAQVFAAADRHKIVVRALESVGNDALHAGLQGRVAVAHGAVEMIERVGAAADIQGVAVGEKRFAAKLLDIVAHDPRPVRAQIGHVAGLAEVDLHRDVFSLKVDLLKAGRFHQALELIQRADLVRAQVRKIDL